MRPRPPAPADDRRARRRPRVEPARPADRAGPGRAIPRPSCAPSRRSSTSTSTRRCTPPRTPRRALAQFQPLGYGEEVEVAPGHPRHVRRCRAHPRLGDHPAARHRARGRRGAGHRLLGRPRPARARRSCATRRRMTDADYVLVESTYGGREHEPEEEAIRILAETVRMVAEAGRRPARPVVRDRPHPGGRLGARPADRARRDPAPAALPRLADGVEGVRHLPPPSGLLRRGDGRAAARGRVAARLPEPDRHQRRARRRRRSSARRGRT